jgi:hypothetical protein
VLEPAGDIVVGIHSVYAMPQSIADRRDRSTCPVPRSGSKASDKFSASIDFGP